jgi:hypothetical protein
MQLAWAFYVAQAIFLLAGTGRLISERIKMLMNYE